MKENDQRKWVKANCKHIFLGKHIGCGSYSNVYEKKNCSEIAIKVCDLKVDTEIEMFKTEVHLAYRLGHYNSTPQIFLARIIHSHDDTSEPMAMGFIEMERFTCIWSGEYDFGITDLLSKIARAEVLCFDLKQSNIMQKMG